MTMHSLCRHGGITAAAVPPAAVMVASHGIRYFSCELETWRASRLAATMPRMPDPVFIIGHWRSGTTLLANLMSFDESFFFPTLIEAVSPHDFFPSSLERLTRKFLPLLFPETRPMDRARVPMRQPFPQEDEMAMAALGAQSFFNAFYFPANASQIVKREVFFEGLSEVEIGQWSETQEGFTRKLALLHPGQRPLLKNPAHTARIPHLRRMYPQARFILLRREKTQVMRSMHRLFEQLWPLLALQRYDLAEIPDLVEVIYENMETRIETDWPGVSEECGFEVEFTDLVATPAKVVRDIHIWLGQPVSAAHKQSIQDYLLNNTA